MAAAVDREGVVAVVVAAASGRETIVAAVGAKVGHRLPATRAAGPDRAQILERTESFDKILA